MAPVFPTMTMLRAFASAAQHLSFTRAGTELGLTQTAISHTIRKLEGILGQPLFERDGNKLRLTLAGTDFLPVARGTVDSVAGASERLREQAEFSVLTVTSVLSFSVKWLLPRLAAFASEFPEIRLQLGANMHLDDPMKPDADVAILYGSGRWPDLVVKPLFEEWITPVCAPELLRSRGDLRKPRDLLQHRLLKTSFYFRYRDDWEPWLKAVGLVLPKDQGAMSFDLLYASLEAARMGMGVAMGRTPLINDDLEAGRLVRPFDLMLKSPLQYYLVARPSVTRTPKYRAFDRWIREKAEAPEPERAARRPPAGPAV